jgi:hypothetical protein
MGDARVKVERLFWMAKLEVSNQLYAMFDPAHDSRYFNPMGKDQGNRGVPMNEPRQPVVRVSWKRAMNFCSWLSGKTGRRFTLPSETQWEWACRAGHAEPFWFGPAGADYGKFANLADVNLGRFGGNQAPPEWRLADRGVDDGALVTAPVKWDRYQANPWGLYNMHGNAAEWTSTPADTTGKRMVRGGSFYDRAYRATASSRLAYPEWAGVHTVGFRVICEEQPGTAVALANPSFEKFDVLNEYDGTLGKNPSGATCVLGQEKRQEASANLLTGPIADQVKAVWAAIKAKNEYFHDKIFAGVIQAGGVPEFMGITPEMVEARREAVFKERMSRMPELFDAIRKTLITQSHQVEIVPIQNR